MSRRGERRRRTVVAKGRAIRKVREVFGLSCGVCKTCGKAHHNFPHALYGLVFHEWSPVKTVRWLKYDQADRKLDKRNSERGKPIVPQLEKQRLNQREQLDDLKGQP